jgi:hypothetical protein
MTEYHNTTIQCTGSGWRARCTARGCNWMGQNHHAFPPNGQALAWHQAQTEGRRHTTDEQRKALQRTPQFPDTSGSIPPEMLKKIMDEGEVS